MDFALDILLDAFKDTVYLLPFLLVTYLIMEWLEHCTGSKTQEAIQHAGTAGPIVGAFLGLFPQCGFSAMSATLYAGRVVSLGTLFAVFLATSDEMIPLFIAEQVPLSTMFLLLGFKLVVALVMGLLIDAVVRLLRRDLQPLRIHELCARDKCGCSNNCETCERVPELIYKHHDDCAASCTHEHHEHNHEHDHKHGAHEVFLSALKHTVQVLLFVFIVTFVLNWIIELVGEDALTNLLQAHSALALFASAVVGLIPNCAASIVIVDLYIQGVLSAGALFAGLLVSAGVGLLVLFRANRPMFQNLKILALLYVCGVFWGFLIQLSGISF